MIIVTMLAHHLQCLLILATWCNWYTATVNMVIQHSTVGHSSDPYWPGCACIHRPSWLPLVLFCIAAMKQHLKLYDEYLSYSSILPPAPAYPTTLSTCICSCCCCCCLSSWCCIMAVKLLLLLFLLSCLSLLQWFRRRLTTEWGVLVSPTRQM